MVSGYSLTSSVDASRAGQDARLSLQSSRAQFESVLQSNFDNFDALEFK